MEQQSNKRADVSDLISVLLSYFMGTFDVNHPGKLFVNEYLVVHAKGHKEIHCLAHLGWVGQIKGIEVLFEEGKQEELKSQYIQLKEQAAAERNGSRAFRQFDLELRKGIQLDLKRRLRSDDKYS